MGVCDVMVVMWGRKEGSGCSQGGGHSGNTDSHCWS